MSNEHENHNPDSDALRQVEQTLVSFTPCLAGIDRDRLMFLAGKASAEGLGAGVQRHGAFWHWPAATAALAATSLALLATLLLRPAPQPQIVYRDRTMSVPSPTSPSQSVLVASQDEGMPRFHPVASPARAVPSSNYVNTRDVALRLGVDAIGAPTYRRGDPLASATYWELLEDIARPKVQSPE